MDRLFSLDLNSWNGKLSADQQAQATEALENGNVVYLPKLAFTFTDDEKKFLTPVWSNGAAKNISYDAATKKIQGMEGDPAAREALAKLLQRYADSTRTLLYTLFPGYGNALERKRTSYRPVEIKGRASKVTKDDTRLHPDQFPARPVRGKRIMRVFCNVNPSSKGRDWRIGEPFKTFAEKFVPTVRPPLPGSSALMYLFRVTRAPRTAYDHYMLNLHDNVKMDDAYQKSCSQTPFSFPAQSTWICFTDEVLHAVDAGQYLLEQTYLLPVSAMKMPAKSPLRVLEAMAGKALV
ncbi:MAG TPA: Kdo hydroxylase family protein [Phycisphaerae bacterium]|nr:Kdo hydroxylase family protein [Phycisphaerae bacterium]